MVAQFFHLSKTFLPIARVWDADDVSRLFCFLPLGCSFWSLKLKLFGLQQGGSSVILCAWWVKLWGAEHLWIQLNTETYFVLALEWGNGCDDSEEMLLIQFQ